MGLQLSKTNRTTDRSYSTRASSLVRAGTSALWRPSRQSKKRPTTRESYLWPSFKWARTVSVVKSSTSVEALPAAALHTDARVSDEISSAVTRVSAAFRGHSLRNSLDNKRQDTAEKALVHQPVGEHSFVQAAGHAGIFKRKDKNVITKAATKREQCVYEAVQATPLQQFLPEYHGAEEAEAMCNIFLEDLTAGMEAPAVMDIKMGMRTFLESEADNPKLRPDLAAKMQKDEQSDLTPFEIENGVTKLRYMQYRDSTSSSLALGWRIEGVRIAGEPYSIPPRKITTREQAIAAIEWWLNGESHILEATLSRLLKLRSTLEESDWFRSHEVVASSLLFVYDSDPDSSCEVRVHMIDFAKTSPVPGATMLSHRIPWAMGNREDGYLTGLDSLIAILRELSEDSVASPAAVHIETD